MSFWNTRNTRLMAGLEWIGPIYKVLSASVKKLITRTKMTATAQVEKESNKQ